MLNEPAEALVGMLLREMPVQAGSMFPLGELTEFDTLKDKLLSRVCPHPCQKHPAVREFLPVIPRHFIEERSLAMHDLVVAEYQNEMFLKCIEHRKRDFPLVISAVDRFFADISQAIVHPTHVPFEAKAETAGVGWA